MQKLYVNEIAPDGEVSTMGLFYSLAEAEEVVTMLRANPDRAMHRYEIVEAVRHILSEKESRQNTSSSKE